MRPVAGDPEDREADRRRLVVLLGENRRTAEARRSRRGVVAAAVVVAAIAAVGCSGRGDSPVARPAEPGDPVVEGSIIPVRRGEMPAHGLGGVDTSSGERIEAVLPPATPGVIAWSDWCFFDAPSTGLGAWQCSMSLSSFAFPLRYLGADEACVLDQYTKLINALADIDGGDITAQSDAAEDAYGWHNCATIIDPDPEDGRSLTAKCEALPEVREDIDALYGSCAQWADEQMEIFHWTPNCSASSGLLWAWMQTHYGDESLSGWLSDC